MRLFAAIHPPSDVLDALAGVVAEVKRAHPGLRWASRTQWHLTLAFYGEADDAAAEALPGLLAAAVAAGPAPRLELAGAGAFPTRAPGRAKVLWAGVEGDLAELAALAERCTEAGTRAGLKPQGHEREFRPHLTLARSREPRDLRGHAALLGDFAGRPWTPEAVDLMISHFPRPGHTLLRELPFADA
ncbi:2'-5' RNA ligase [Actinocorallia herbida]|uniref:RNA 2',3'-cyclic phosphodiesterase n=1 Tax=Actinocorallia herbida TaxID=58109 RepID=A0A3N1DCP3_9ACTN|nr:RNA 2',3'-cyclic phosphodiesterase [Actinocorallia herbida]ROO91280.1 2'-5' RNA ligase [Actinocorallia herbida]